MKLQFLKCEINHYNEKVTVAKLKVRLTYWGDGRDPFTTVYGKAKVSSGDTFNEKKGAMIAESKARIKAYRWALRELEMFNRVAADVVAEGSMAAAKIGQYLATEMKHCITLTTE